MRRKSHHLLKNNGASYLAAGLISTWDVTAKAQPISFSGAITPNQNLSDVYFFYSLGDCYPGYTKKITDFITGNTTLNFSITLRNIPANAYSPNGYYTIAGLYGDPANGSVAVAMSSALAASSITQSLSWNGESIGSIDFLGWTESQLATALQSGQFGGMSLDDAGGSYDPLSSGFLGVLSPALTPDPAGSTYTLVDFSSASYGGSGSVIETTPEPTTIALFATSTALLSFGWLRRRK